MLIVSRVPIAKKARIGCGYRNMPIVVLKQGVVSNKVKIPWSVAVQNHIIPKMT